MNKRSFRLIAVDLDGTLLLPDGRVSARNRTAVLAAVEAGYDVVFATGRNYTESRSILEGVGHLDMGVFVSGAVVMNLQTRQVVHRLRMHSDLAREISGVIEEMGHAALALQDHDLATSDYIATADIELDEATRQWSAVTSARIQRAGRLAQYEHPHTLRVGLVAGRDQSAKMEKLLLERLGGRVVVHSLFVPAYDVEVLEVFDPAVSKWEAVRKIADDRGIAAEEIVAVGDDVNDISMIRGAGLGVAMGNAKPAVLAAAKRVLKANTEDGLAEFLEELTAKRPAVRKPRVAYCRG